MKHFLRLVYLADNNLHEGIKLGYHSHNNLQQAFSNAQAMAELNLNRDIILDACVFGMGRGAGNLNMELFAGYLNEEYGKNYHIEPMLEITDLYLNDIYKNHFWGYSLPFYLSSINSCHPNYAIYLEKKGSLTAKSFNEILRSIPQDKKAIYSKDFAETLYQNYQKNYVDDSNTLKKLSAGMCGNSILILAPGKSLNQYSEVIHTFIKKYNPIIVSLSYYSSEYKSDYVFCTNARRYDKLTDIENAISIITSNIRDNNPDLYVLNYSSYLCDVAEIAENSGIMFLNVLITLGIKEVFIAGMDGYEIADNFFSTKLDVTYSRDETNLRNELISKQLKIIFKSIDVHWLTPTEYI